MFKIASVADELYNSMERTLVSHQVDERQGFSKLARAIDYLNLAAKIFEKSGLNSEANEITKVLQSLAHDMQK